MPQFTVERLGQQGDGICRDGDARVYARGVLPGEVISGDVIDGRIDRAGILTPSLHRVRPPCAHAQACGGCAFQHASDDFVAEWKCDQVRLALADVGMDGDVTLAHVSPPQTRRRATLAGTRTKKGALVGFHAKRSDTIVPVPGCKVLDPAIVAVLPALHDLTVMLASRKAVLGFMVTATDSGLDIDIDNAAAPDPLAIADIAALAEGSGIARLSLNGETLVQHSIPKVTLGQTRVPIPHRSFMQATALAQSAMQGLVTAALEGCTRIADLFCGMGTFALPLAQHSAIDGFDSGDAMIAAMNAGLRGATGLRPVTAHPRDLFRDPLLGDELAPFDGVVIDPPRAGAQAQMAQLADSDVPVIAAVSCNPVTFARDAALLIAGGYRPGPVHVIDQFRWSPHIELVADFRRA